MLGVNLDAFSGLTCFHSYLVVLGLSLGVLVLTRGLSMYGKKCVVKIGVSNVGA